jgi:DtxR family transcriptional regulator, Mn-dependent transcriptional regulator
MALPNEKLSASLEDYLEAIYNLSSDNQFARAKDIAQTLQVARASVTGALRTLAERELVNYKPYGYITLTERGRKLAWRVARRHETLSLFFAEVLGVEETTAQKAACRAEHTLGPEVSRRLAAFVEFIHQSQEQGHDVAQLFQQYWSLKERS